MRGRHEWRAAEVEAAEPIAENVRRIVLRMEGAPRPFEPGAHTTIRVQTPAGPTTRSYTVVPSGPGKIAVAVKSHPASRGGSRFMWSLKPGNRVDVTVPENRFELSFRAPHYLLMAGGIGVTPIFGMAEALVKRGAAVRMVYAARSRAVMAYADELEKLLRNQLELFASDEGQRIDIEAEIAALPDGTELYLCGPIQMLNHVKQAWATSGRTPGKLRYEVFGDSGEFAEEPFEVTVPNLGVSLKVASNQTLLEALRSAGVDMIAECERGECGLCVVDVLGHDSPIDHRDVFLSDVDKRAGLKLCSCVSRFVGGSASIDVGYRKDVSRVAGG